MLWTRSCACSLQKLVDRPAVVNATSGRTNSLKGMIAIVKAVTLGARIARPGDDLGAPALGRSVALDAFRDPGDEHVGRGL